MLDDLQIFFIYLFILYARVITFFATFGLKCCLPFSANCITLILHRQRRRTTAILSSPVSSKCPFANAEGTWTWPVKANLEFLLMSNPPRPTHTPSPPPNSPVPQCCDTSTRQRRLPDNPYQKRFGGLLVRPLSKSFLSMEGNVTPILKAGVREGRRERRAGRR